MATTKPSTLAPGAAYEFSRPPQSVPATRAPYRQDDPAGYGVGCHVRGGFGTLLGSGWVLSTLGWVLYSLTYAGGDVMWDCFAA
jgi:hypothetical protein